MLGEAISVIQSNEVSSYLLPVNEQQIVLNASSWKTTATFLVLFMQIGFLALESGWVRSKNSISVAQRNIADFSICFLTFFLIGFTIAFGPSISGFIGWNWGNSAAFVNNHIDQFLFQAVFAGAAVTIASGTLAERMKFKAYLFLAIITSVFIYPVVCHWVWGNTVIANNTSWLYDMGYRDYAGSTVVHSVGGWIALAAAIILGPRTGKFDRDGTPQRMPCHSMVLSGIGTLILLISWIGFNAGNAQPATPVFKLIILNTLLSATAGMLTALLFAYFRDNTFMPQRSTNGLLGGLVAISASCNAVSPQSAIMIGMIAGILVCIAEDFIEQNMKIDDVVGAISVHAVCGLTGALLFALFAFPDALPAGNRLDQLLIQAQGAGIIFLYTFIVGFTLVLILNMIMPIRISAEDELLGSNLTEHNITLETETLLEKERAINEEQRQFINMATHEFRTPLSIIDILARNLRKRWDKYTQSDATTKTLNIQKSVKRITGLIDTILNIGKLDEGNIRFEPVPTQLQRYIADRQRELALISEKHDIRLQMSCNHPIWVNIDPNLFDNIIDNLITNAIKYSPDGGFIDINVDQDDDQVMIAFRDYGVGIPEDEIPKLFQKFFRASTSSGIGGTGIGLTVVKSFIDMHKGAIEVESNVGQGTCFKISIPILSMGKYKKQQNNEQGIAV